MVGNGDELTVRERDVLRLLADGLSNRAIAAELGISSRTVEAHVRGLLRKLAVSSRSELISRWLRSGQDAQLASAGTLWLTEPERNHPWSRPLAGLLRDREHDAAFAMMVEIVETQPSWEAGLDLLKLGEMLGRATDVLRHYVRLVDEIQSGPSAEVARAIAYYRGRLLSQVGLIRSALDVHTANLPAGGVLFGGPYQRRSRFAIAHLRFKVEDFAQAQRQFDELHQGLSTVHEPDRRYVVDVYQFCATLALISVVHDLPHSSARAVPVDLDAARHFSTEALRLSLMENYPEGIVWAQAVQAFTAEASGEPERAELLWRTTRRSALALAAQWSVKVHVLLYEAGFERRRQQLDAASERISEAEKFLPVDPNLRLRARVLEEKALVLRDRGGDLRAVRNLFHEALNRYSLEPGLILLSDWPITARLRRTCRDLRLDYGSYLLPGRATHEQPG